METESSMLPTTIDVDQIEYGSHVHPLTLCEIYGRCSICGERCLGGRTYGCYECDLYLHESCTKIEIPQEIDHYFHRHSLRLAMNERSHPWCRACKDSLSGLMFECYDCEFYMCVECALLPTKLKQDGCTVDHIQHFQHPHPLMLCEDDEKKYASKFCRACDGGLSTPPCYSYDTSLLSQGSESIYGCLRLQCRSFFLHERCARLPRKIDDSPFHPGHSLELIWSTEYNRRQGCGVPAITYRCCDSCPFTLRLECAFLRAPILKFESHDHLLTLFPSVNPKLSCQICNEACDSSNIFRCIDCDYNLHLHCGPLPCSIKDECHDHPLKLMHAFVEDGYEDDIVYCDACEQPRDPEECVYYCKDCSFFTELKCVMAEVLRSLNGERGNVKLRTANKTRIRVGAKLISNVNVETDSDNEIEDIGAKYLEVKIHENFFSCSYTDEECEQLTEILMKARVRLHPSFLAFCLERNRRKQEFENSIFCYSSDEESDNGDNAIAEPYTDDFKQLMRNLDSYYDEDELLETFFGEDCSIVRIGEHKIAQHSASVLKGLLHKYGDFTTKSKLSERLKAIFLTMFCQVIHTMCLTKAREVDHGMLRKWWKSLKLAQHAGFEIQFAIDQLYKVVQASFGMKAISSYREMKSRVDILSNEIEEEEAKLEEKKRQLVELKSSVDERRYGIEYQSSPVLKDCVNKASEFKWKMAWDGSPIMFR